MRNNIHTYILNICVPQMLRNSLIGAKGAISAHIHAKQSRDIMQVFEMILLIVLKFTIIEEISIEFNLN